MSTQISTALVNAYRSNIEVQFQQKGSKLRPTVRNEVQRAEYEYFDRIGSVTAVQVTSRHGDTVYSDTPHTRRRNALKRYDWADLIDDADKLQMLADPTSGYVQNAVFAMGRAIDSEIISAATGHAYAGKAGGTETDFDTNNTIAVNYVESGSTANSNLTIGKLRRAKYILDHADAIPDGEMCTCVLTASQVSSLLKTTEVTSSDYNSVKALVAGQIDTFLGFKFVRTELVGTDSSSYRRVLVYPQSGIVLGVAKDITVNVDPLPGKRYSTQVFVSAQFGASRMWEEQVVEILCDETV